MTRERTPVSVETEQGEVVVSVRPLPVNITSGVDPVTIKFDPFAVVTTN
jgi:hypothetical protein